VIVRAVLLDLGNTLLDYAQHGHWREFLSQRLVEMRPLIRDLCAATEPPADLVKHMVGAIGERPRELERSGRSWHFTDRLRVALSALGMCVGDDALDRLTDALYDPIRAGTRPYPETRDALDCLRALGVKQAIITNSPWDTPARLPRADLERWGMANYFAAFICSGDVPWRKPNPSFMQAAADALGVAPEECLVVGDTLEVDVAGAVAAGMPAVWINRDDEALPPGGPQPTWTAGELGEVVGIVGARSEPR
jgi:HAD superfamily hydrolase (TIGR01509 family)